MSPAAQSDQSYFLMCKWRRNRRGKAAPFYCAEDRKTATALCEVLARRLPIWTFEVRGSSELSRAESLDYRLTVQELGQGHAGRLLNEHAYVDDEDYMLSRMRVYDEAKKLHNALLGNRSDADVVAALHAPDKESPDSGTGSAESENAAGAPNEPEQPDRPLSEAGKGLGQSGAGMNDTLACEPHTPETGASGAGNEATQRLKPSREKAKALYEWGIEHISGADEMTYSQLFQALLDDPNCAGEGLPDNAEAFARYCRDAGVRRYSPKPAKGATKSIRRASSQL